jgi:Fe-S-cluster containining protein
MSDDTDQTGAYAVPARLLFPAAEAAFPWLPMLLDAYFVADQGVAQGIRQQTDLGRTLACARGCSACCRSHATIPVYPLELAGLTWYATEHIQGEVRGKLKAQLLQHKTSDPCPFLVDGACSVHPMRPLACRHFNVFGKVCAEGEDAFYSRPEDVLAPVTEYMDAAFFIMLPYYGVTDETERRRLIGAGAMHKLARVLQECRWPSLMQSMQAFDDRQPAGG